ncbi:MAG: HEAT repeat domain-containing protein [Acidobacteria bacterium]|nr:HEAT repeat domain-containing protein [Acidobacteriota bacterium]
MSEEPTPTSTQSLEEAESSSPLRAFFGLFIIPLLVVLICVGVFVGFGWIAYDRQDLDGYLNDLRSSWRPRRAQAAYELSKILVADPEALSEQPGAAAEVRRLFLAAEDVEIKRYLALVLGYTHDPESVPVLADALAAEDDSQTRIYLLWALGRTGDSSAVPALMGELDSEDSGIRKVAAYALGELGDVAAVPRLEAMLVDGTADVRWNAALAVSRLGSREAAPVLHRMLDRELTGKIPEITPDQQEETMIGALGALARIDGSNALEIFERLAKSDPSYRVRQAAIDARKYVDGQKP